MPKFRLSMLGLALACLLAPHASQACSCFATYFDEPLYGMNFDYPEVAIKFNLHEHDGRQVFQMNFLADHGWVPTVGMNSDGLFASCQMLYPAEKDRPNRAPDEIYTWQLYRYALNNFTNLQELEEYLKKKRVIHWSISLHDFFADAGGEAMVVEVGDEENAITRIDGDYLVMTNFPNRGIGDDDPDDVVGIGADRYKKACRKIEAHEHDFDVARAFDTLESAVSLGGSSTLCSMVFDPARKEVYVAVKRDFERIWKISLVAGTLETHSGFDLFRSIPLDVEGVTASSLVELVAAGESH